ncbi:hypothetical protein EPH_0026910 [Eimeria praecox]|uniref:WD domain, G-beta repeat-containing protein n=1 Tax=Eimeria praecox TaxID=51316 RepID=U6G9H5_9EIME|nr:hypothetical protein EPH_0026910 [Eimeria praecox]
MVYYRGKLPLDKWRASRRNSVVSGIIENIITVGSISPRGLTVDVACMCALDFLLCMRRDECHAVIPSARPLRSLKGLIMGHSVQDIGNTDPPSGDGQMANQLPGIEERRAPLPNVQPGVDCGVLSFFGRPMWYSDFAADQNIFIQPEEVDGTERGCSIRPSTPTPPSNTPLPAALFGHVALFLGAEDVVALASACKSLRWIGFHRDAWKSLCFSEDISQRRDVDWSDAALSCEGELGRRDSPSESRAYPSAPTDMAWEAETRCRGLQVLPECTLHELVDWRFLYLLNRVSPGPRIHVHVRELELQFPMALNISQPMRLRHLRPGNRPGLCVAEILREQHYLLEWQVPLRFLQEPSAHSTRFIAEAQNDSTPVWPLPPYGSLELDSLAQLGGNWRRQERMAVHNVVDEDRPHSSQRAPEVDAVHDDRLIFDVLDRGSVFASLLSPLSFGTTAAAIFVGALLVAVATSSAAAAITTAAAATATLAARRSRIFRVDLHVLERDEHEDDQEEVVECDISQSLLVSSFSGSLGMPPRQLATSGYDSHIQVVNEAASCGSGPQSVCGPVSSGSEEAVGDQGGSYVSNNLRLRLPCLRRLFQDQLARLFRSSALAGAALTETSRALACTIMSSISRDTTASTSEYRKRRAIAGEGRASAIKAAGCVGRFGVSSLTTCDAVRALSAGAAILQHPQHPLRRPLWRSSRSTSESNSRETEREDTSSSDQEHTQGCEMNEANATWASTREFWEENFGSASSDWRVESPPLQPGHGLLLFVRTCLPPATALLRPRGTTKWHSLGTEWDVAAATSFTGLPEDVPLLLPTDATVTDLVRLLFLTLLERKYMLPLISASPVGEPQLGSSYLDGKTDRPNCRRRKDRSGQTVYSSRVALLRFWLASTHPREHHVEQPLPSAKLAADLRLTSCERLTLAIAPFSLARCGASASAGCLTLTCASRGPPTQKTGYLRGNSTGVQSGAALSPCDAHQCPSEDKRPPSEASPWLLSPLSAWTQDNTLSVETTSPADGEPTLVLRREAGQEPVFRTAEPGDACSQREPCLYVESLFEELRLNSCPTDTEQHEANKRDNDASMCALSEVLKDREPTSASKHTEGIALQGSEQGQEGNIIHSSAGSAASAGTAQRYAGIVQEEEDARLCKPWILQSSVNARQFEYHPAKSNVLLTGNNDGRVRVLDWKRDVVLGTELVDSHPILALSWLKHHPELFVCAAGVSGIPYVVRWREQDDILTNEIKGDRGRMPKASAFHSQSCLPVNMQPRQLAQQRQHVETGDYEVIHDDQYSGDRDDCLDGSTVTAALTWFRRCGRGERLSREGTASLRIVHQYCACEDLSSVSVNSTDDYLLVSGRSADLTIHDVATGARLGTLSGLHSDSINIVRFAHISPHLFVTASFDQTCRLWDLRQRINGHQPLLTVDTGSLSVMCCFDDSDEWLLCSGVDAALRQVCLRSSTVFPQSFAIPPVNAETNFRRAVYLQGGREFITAGTEEGFFRVFSRLGRDLGLVSLEGLLRPFIRERSPQGLATLADLQAELLNLPIYLRSHMALGLSAMSDAALATAAGVSRSSVAAVLRTALRHISGGPAGLLDRELLDRMRQAVNGPGSPWFFIWQQGMRSESRLFQEAGTGSAENDAVEEYVQSLRAHPQERRLVGALLAAKDQVETANGEASYVAMSRLPATMLG